MRLTAVFAVLGERCSISSMMELKLARSFVLINTRGDSNLVRGECNHPNQEVCSGNNHVCRFWFQLPLIFRGSITHMMDGGGFVNQCDQLSMLIFLVT